MGITKKLEGLGFLCEVIGGNGKQGKRFRAVMIIITYIPCNLPVSSKEYFSNEKELLEKIQEETKARVAPRKDIHLTIFSGVSTFYGKKEVRYDEKARCCPD